MRKISSLPNLKLNIFGLFALHGCGFVLTFASIPYLTNVFGVDGWGKIVFVQLVLNYLCWVSNWGFYLGGTREVAAVRSDPNEINRLLSTSLAAQLVLTILGLVVLTVVILSVDSFSADRSLYLSGMLVVIGNFLMPLWFLNGLEKIVQSSIIQISVKLLCLLSYFLLIENRDQIYLYFLINGSIMIFIGIFTLGYIFLYLNHRLSQLSFADVIHTIKKHLSLFLGTMMANVNSSIIPFALGIASGDQALGYFNIADRMRTAAVQVLHPISHALFPRMGYLMENDRSAAKNLALKSGFLLGSLSFLLSLVLLIFAENIVYLIAGVEFKGSIIILQILAFSPFLATLYAFLVYQLVIPAGLNKAYLISVVTMSGCAAVLIFPVLFKFDLSGVAFLAVAIELIGLALLVHLALFRKKIFSLQSDYKSAVE